MTALAALAWSSTVLFTVHQRLTRTARRPAPAGERARSALTRSRRKTAAAVLLAVASVAIVTFAAGPLAAVVVVAVTLLVRRLRALRVVRSRAALVDDAAPEVVELVRLAVTSGLTPYLALVEVAPLAPAPFDEELTVVLGDVRRGHRLADALAAMVGRVGSSARPLCAALVATERYGISLLPALDSAAVELRRARRVALEARARRLPVLLSFPLVCCVLPAFALLALAPVAAGAVRALHQPAASAQPSPSASEPDPGPMHPLSTIQAAIPAVPTGANRP
jgi:tight adherence protein C